MKTRHETKNITITGKVLQLTIASFFVANIMTVIGSVIDGFVIGNAMNESAAAAVGLISPLVILFAVIGATTGISFQSRSLKCLSRGDAAGAVIGGFILLLVNPMYAVMFVAITLVLQVCDGYIIKPKLFGNSLGVSGLLILLAIVTMGNAFGIGGILLAIPVAAICDFSYREGVLPYLQKRKERKQAAAEKEVQK